ncbi:hypothetical protein LY90DRAFT_115002 [Neocallimastix californiae]|uniref:Secreted protein n=1 Tax=Neocallimastix californiae TaxID=1754190 RepID=A0A1Y2APZ3_9FUNG|nr:hypothetical protein LY90DRAFT_115002 [Neocallimastix californiae]|eukprot:ORY24611.1 hypothetical protein LY90DRAFT_115002 [Neocallimastix californiae]
MIPCCIIGALNTSCIVFCFLSILLQSCLSISDLSISDLYSVVNDVLFDSFPFEVSSDIFVLSKSKGSQALFIVEGCMDDIISNSSKSENS